MVLETEIKILEKVLSQCVGDNNVNPEQIIPAKRAQLQEADKMIFEANELLKECDALIEEVAPASEDEEENMEQNNTF